MRLSTRGRYGLAAMIYLGKKYGDNPVSLNEISKATGLSNNYLEQLIRELKKQDLVISVRGVQGGYLLKKSPKEISVSEILECLEEFFGVTECSVVPGLCSREDTCPSRLIWTQMHDDMINSIKNVSLQDLISKEK
ncbi:MAG: Rrf2 family transcriptional regulator [Finegoldia magna]|uniref:Transcriptional regulator n=1 Tax=Finegoldia magna TaxID=1260 RepID=A0A233V4W8_FINMA|nr:Rrf2 family transcriptional regulator [Finegoldia magna]MDU5224173.1 Rrf2 family transcriptional regulator [Finegoldia magna]MDU5236431.1 Rrf2 family transcriptional regulator [Finegoldia magna]OXZ27423.1 transcriptional regulator [Finegoldia magna]